MNNNNDKNNRDPIDQQQEENQQKQQEKMSEIIGVNSTNNPNTIIDHGNSTVTFVNEKNENNEPNGGKDKKK